MAIFSTHWGRVTHICVSKLTIIGFIQWLVAWPAPSYHLNQCWNIVNWTIRNKIRWNLNRNSYISIKENAFENVVWKMVAILSRSQSVNDCIRYGKQSDLMRITLFSCWWRMCQCVSPVPRSTQGMCDLYLEIDTLFTNDAWTCDPRVGCFHWCGGKWLMIFKTMTVWRPSNLIREDFPLEIISHPGQRAVMENLRIRKDLEKAYVCDSSKHHNWPHKLICNYQ